MRSNGQATKTGIRKEGTWQVCAQEMDLMVRLLGIIDYCPRTSERHLQASPGWVNILSANNYPFLFSFLIYCLFSLPLTILVKAPDLLSWFHCKIRVQLSRRIFSFG